MIYEWDPSSKKIIGSSCTQKHQTLLFMLIVPFIHETLVRLGNLLIYNLAGDTRKTIDYVFFCLLANVDSQSANVHFAAVCSSLQQFGRSILGKVIRCDESVPQAFLVLQSPQLYSLVTLCPESSWKVFIGLLRKVDKIVSFAVEPLQVELFYFYPVMLFNLLLTKGIFVFQLSWYSTGFTIAPTTQESEVMLGKSVLSGA